MRSLSSLFKLEACVSSVAFPWCVAPLLATTFLFLSLRAQLQRLPSPPCFLDHTSAN